MAIEKTVLFEQARERWPSAVHVVPTQGVPCFRTEPSLFEIYETVEACCKLTGERTGEQEWTSLANWSFHQAFWTLAERSASEREIAREDVTFEMFDDQMRSNLSDDCWSAERREYEESPSRFH